MNRTEARVVRLEGEDAWLEAVGPGKACGACSQAGGCGGTGQGRLLEGALGQARQPLLIRLPNTIRARPGDVVIIEAPPGAILKAVWRAYGLPLLLAIMGAGLAQGLGADEGWSFFALLLGLAIGFLALRRQRLDTKHAKPILSMRFK